MSDSQYPAPGLKGADFYHGDNVTSFHALAADGIAFVFLKASQGATYVDPSYRDRYARCNECQIIPGAYHFFTADAPIVQAKHFITTAALITGDLIPALDVETEFEGVGVAALACAMEIKRLCGKFPILYASDSFYQDYLKAAWPEDTALWIARYGAEPVTQCSFFQFSENGSLPGVDGYSDLDVFNGTMDELQVFLMP